MIIRSFWFVMCFKERKRHEMFIRKGNKLDAEFTLEHAHKQLDAHIPNHSA